MTAPDPRTDVVAYALWNLDARRSGTDREAIWLRVRSHYRAAAAEALDALAEYDAGRLDPPAPGPGEPVYLDGVGRFEVNEAPGLFDSTAARTDTPAYAVEP